MANKNLFEQAIIDAKAIREAAIANAKLALEENLTEGVKEMLAEKLKALEEEVIDEEVDMDEGTPSMEEISSCMAEGMSCEEICEKYSHCDEAKICEMYEACSKSMEEEAVAEGKEEAMEEEVVAEADEEEVEVEDDAAEEDEAEDDSEEVEDEVEDSEEVDSEVEDMSIEDLKDLIRDILAQEMGEEDEDEADMEVDLEEPVDGIEEPAEMAADEEEVNLEELLSELSEGMDEGMPSMEEISSCMAEGMSCEEICEKYSHCDEAKICEMYEACSKSMEEEANDMNLQGNQDVAEGEMDEGEVNEVGAFMTKYFEAMNALVDTLGVSNDVASMLVGLAGVTGVVGGAAVLNWVNEKGPEFIAKVKAKLGVKEEDTHEGEMDEAVETINKLQEELNEVNLLNAKLLYLNKIFKSNNLTESQKANTIASFDKAETVKEVKLVFETVSENLTTSTTKKPMNEVKGMASKAAGVAPKKPEMIVETSEAVLRMQKLAGIVK